MPAPQEEVTPEPSAPEEVPVPLFTFRVGPVWYAVAAQAVHSVVGATPTVRIPGTPAFIAGVASVAGRIAVVMELALLLGRAHAPGHTVADRLVLFDAAGSVVAALTDEVSGVLSVVPSRLTRAASGGEDSPVVQTFTDADRHVTVLDVPRLIARAESSVRQRGES